MYNDSKERKKEDSLIAVSREDKMLKEKRGKGTHESVEGAYDKLNGSQDVVTTLLEADH